MELLQELGQAGKNYTDAEIEEERRRNELEEKMEEKIIGTDIYKIPYEGLGYKFIYDGTLGEPGLTGKNMCNELTGGWSTARTTYTCDGGMNYAWYLGWIYTNNKIDLTNYSKLCVSSYMLGNPNSIENFVYSNKDKQKSDNGISFSNSRELVDFLYSHPVGKTIETIDIPENWNGFIGICTHHSTSNEYYFDYQSSYMRNYSESTRYMDLYSIVALKEDDWQSWVKFAEIDVENEENNSLEKILNNPTILKKIFENQTANMYLLKCTGTLMVEILKNDNSYNSIPNALLEEMKNNESWNHFLKVCERN